MRWAESSGPIQTSAGATVARRPRNAAPQARAAILFGSLLAVQFAAAALTPLDSGESDSFWSHFVAPAIGVSVAWPALLAVWTVFGPQRAAVRLPLTLWLAAAVSLVGLYGLNRNAGESGAQSLFINAVWLLAFGVLQPPLWLIRAVRRWRLELAENGPETDPRLATKSSSQFSLRAMLGWTLAVAMLLAGLHWLAPDIGLEMEELLMFLPDAGWIGLVVALGGLPVIALAWIVLADGRRRTLRIVLSLLILLGLAGAGGFFSGNSPALSAADMLSFAAGLLLNGLVSFGVVRACGYRLGRRSKKRIEASAPNPPAPAPISRLRFNGALAPLVIAAAGLACSVPHRMEMWRQAEVRADWRRIGLEVSFDGDGTITSLKCNKKPLADEMCRRIASLADLLVLDLSASTIDDRQLALLAPLKRLENLDLSATAVTDAGLKHLRHFPQLSDLNLTNTPITDAGLESLKQLPKLEALRVTLTDISDEGLSSLEQLPALRTVNAQLTAVTAAGAANFRNAHRLANIEFGASDALLGRLPGTRRTHIRYSTGFQSIGVSHIKLKRLHARGQAVTNGVPAAVTDAGLVSLAVAHAELEELDLRESAVTDKGLTSLRKLQNLKRLDLRGAAVTEQGVSRLARLLPECQILR